MFGTLPTTLIYLFSMTVGTWANSNVSSNKCVRLTNIALKPKPNTSHNQQANAIIERVHKFRSFYLKNNHGNLEEQEDIPFDYFLQLTVLLPSY
jgi:hypothetical protein